MTFDAYEILGVERDANRDEIKAAYRKAAQKYHPDKFQSDSDRDKATAEFKEIGRAYATLMDDELRKRHDSPEKAWAMAGLTNLFGAVLAEGHVANILQVARERLVDKTQLTNKRKMAIEMRLETLEALRTAVNGGPVWSEAYVAALESEIEDSRLLLSISEEMITQLNTLLKILVANFSEGGDDPLRSVGQTSYMWLA